MIFFVVVIVDGRSNADSISLKKRCHYHHSYSTSQYEFVKAYKPENRKIEDQERSSRRSHREHRHHEDRNSVEILDDRHSRYHEDRRDSSYRDSHHVGSSTSNVLEKSTNNNHHHHRLSDRHNRDDKTHKSSNYYNASLHRHDDGDVIDDEKRDAASSHRRRDHHHHSSRRYESDARSGKHRSSQRHRKHDDRNHDGHKRHDQSKDHQDNHHYYSNRHRSKDVGVSDKFISLSQDRGNDTHERKRLSHTENDVKIQRQKFHESLDEEIDEQRNDDDDSKFLEAARQRRLAVLEKYSKKSQESSSMSECRSPSEKRIKLDQHDAADASSPSVWVSNTAFPSSTSSLKGMEDVSGQASPRTSSSTAPQNCGTLDGDCMVADEEAFLLAAADVPEDDDENETILKCEGSDMGSPTVDRDQSPKTTPGDAPIEEVKSSISLVRELRHSQFYKKIDVFIN